ncbi:MAG: hypothetical protein ABIL07_07970 [candidate division WOR-3 bacterium]
MKKLLITLIPSVILLCFILTLTPSKVKADPLAHWLSGHVHYSNGSGVGSGKKVYVYDSPMHYIGYDETNQASEYQWNFYGSLYVYKVRCGFYVGTTYYSGETIIDDTLTVDTRVDITVYPGGAPPERIEP